MDTTTLTVFEQFETDIVAFEKHNASLEFDVKTPDGKSECESHCRKLRKVWNAIEGKRKEIKKEYIDKGKQVDLEAKSFQIRIDTMHDLHKKPLDELAAAEAAKKQAFLDAEQKKRDDKAEADAKELEELRELKAENERKEREAKIAKDAIAKAKADAIAAAKKAEQDKLDAIAKAKADAEAEAKKVEDARLAKVESDRIETARLAQIEADRVADVEHRTKIERDIQQGVVAVLGGKTLGNEDLAAKILVGIKTGEIPNVSINY